MMSDETIRGEFASGHEKNLHYVLPDSVRYIAPRLMQDDKGNTITENLFGFVGAVADRTIMLERLDPRSELWCNTDRIFPGERYRLGFIKVSAMINQSPLQARRDYEKEKKDWHGSSSSKLYPIRTPTRVDMRLSHFFLALLTCALIAIAAYAWMSR